MAKSWFKVGARMTSVRIKFEDIRDGGSRVVVLRLSGGRFGW